MSQKTSTEAELDVDGTEAEDDEAYITYDIASYPSDLTLKVLKSMWDDGDIVIPKFQRNFVWNIKQSSLLIDSFLMGLPVPQAFFFIDDEQKALVIDGQQRITSIVFFLEGFFGEESMQGKKSVFRLKGLDEKSPFQNKRYEDLEEKDRRKLENAVLRVVNIRQMNPSNNDTAAYHIFERLNTGGTPLKPQEIRNCVFNGDIVEELYKLNQNEHWRQIIGKKYLDKHQRDVEMLLRCFSMYERGDEYEKPMKEFLNISMKNSKNANTKSFRKFSERFPKVCEKIIESFGEKPFHVRGPINLAALDAVFPVCIENHNADFSLAAQEYRELLEDEDFREVIFFNTSDSATVEERREYASEIFS